MATQQEQTKLLQELEKNTDALKASVAGLSDEQARRKPTPDAWSPLEILEHVVVVNCHFRHRVETAAPLDQPLVEPEREAELAHRAVDRTERRSAPETSIPKSKFQTLAEALSAIDADMEVNRAFLREYGPRLRSLQFEHPKWGKRTGFDAVNVMCGHTLRHAHQIHEQRKSQ